MNKRLLILLSISSLFFFWSGIVLRSKLDSSSEPLCFGIIADCQYCTDKGSGVRKYSLSTAKLSECVLHLNQKEVELTVHLGDFIDRDWTSFDSVGPIYNQLNHPAYHVLGNHDFSVADSLKSKVVSKMGLDDPYYDFKLGS